MPESAGAPTTETESERWRVIQRGRVTISAEEAIAREDAGEPRLTTADRWHGLDVALVRSGDELLENKGEWVHRRRTEPEARDAG